MKVVLTSDWHEAPFGKDKFKTQKWSIGEMIIKLFSGKGRREKMIKKMKEVIRLLEIKTVFHNGDIQENVLNERGLFMTSDLASATEIIERFQFETGAEILLNMGNHESGYGKETLPLATDPDGGVTRESIDHFLKLTGQESVYQSYVIGGHRFCLIPYILTEKCGKNFEIGVLKYHILMKFADDLAKDEPVILLMHDPDSLCDVNFRQLIGENRERISLVFCGHCHADVSLAVNKATVKIFSSLWLSPIRLGARLLLSIFFDSTVSRGVEDYYKERKDVARYMDEFDIQLIPAPMGMMGIGGGFMILDLDDLEVEVVS